MGEYEEWFNYRLSRAAPDTCAEFLGSFVADKTNTVFTKGGKWLVWRFEVPLPPSTHYHIMIHKCIFYFCVESSDLCVCIVVTGRP